MEQTQQAPPPFEAALATLVENGDLDRIVALARVVGSAQDALSDDMVTRLAGMATDGLELLDRVNRSGVGRALPAISALVENGDLDRIVALARVVGSAQDALNDEMVGRVAGMATDGLELLDRVNRSGVGRALPAITALVDNGDLDRIVALARVVGSAQDALSDEMVTRLAGLATDGLDLLDRVNRSGVARALPAITALVDNGDLDRIVALARVVGSAQDALSDDMVTRLAGLATDAVAIIDRVTRNGFVDRWLTLADRVERSGLLSDLITAIDQAGKDVAAAPRPQGGFAGLWTLMKQQQTQEAAQFVNAIIRALRAARVKSG